MPSPRLTRLAELLLPLTLGLAAVVALIYAVRAIGLHWELYVGEQENVYFAHQLASEGSLYRDWGGLNLLFPIYAPGMYVLVAPLTWLGGADLWSGRLVSLLATLLAGGAAWRTAALLGASRIEALCSGLAFLSMPSAAIVLFDARPDAIVLALAAGLLLATTSWERSGDRRALWLAGVAGVAIILTKQNFSFLILAALISVFFRDRRSAVWLAGGIAAGALVLAGLTELLSSGAFSSNLRDFADTGYSLSSLDYVVKGTLLPYPNPIFAVGAIEAALLLRRPGEAPAAAWAWPAGLLVLITSIKVGADTNYSIALGLASAILVGPALARARGLGGRGLAAAAGGALALLIAPAAIQAARDLPNSIRHLSDVDSANDAAVAKIKTVPGRMFGDRLDLALATDQPPGIDDALSYLLYANGKWDPAEVSRALRNRRFALVQTSFDLNGAAPGWPPQMVDAARASYCPYWSRAVGFPGQPIYLYRPCNRR